MEALKPKPAKKSRKPKGAAALSEEVDVNDVNGKNEENVKKVTAYLQYRAESASGLSSNLLVSDSVVPEATDSEAQRNKSIEIVVPIASPERVAISAFPKEPVAVPPPANEPETCVRPREDIASVPPPTEVTASAPPPIEVIASARSPVAISAVPKEPVAVPPSANEPETCVRPSEDIASAPPPTEVIASVRSPIEVIASARSAIEVGTTDALANQDSACADSTYELEASAPPDDEPLYSKIYPDLPTLEMSEEAIGEEDTVDVTAIDLPAMLSDEEKMQLFSGVSIAWLEEGERWFVNQEKSAVFHPNDDKEWSRQKLQQKLTLYGRLHHQLTGPFVEQRKATQSKLTHLEDEMWRLEERIFESNGVCQDHREIKARAKRTFAVYDGQRGKTALATLSRTLDRQIREEKAASMERQDLRIDLQYHFVRACGEPENKDYLTVIIIVLAEMLRNEAASQSCTMRDSCPYQRDLRLWFRFVCARYMKTLELSDRQYVLYHVLRLPGGIKSWAVELVQMLPARRVKELAEHSNQALATHEVREILIMLNIVMRPVAQRNALYRSAVAFDEADQYTWVDSDGEGEDAAAERTLYPLTEDDMNALLEQLPVPAFMQTLKFHISQRNCLAGIITAVEFTQTLLEGCRTYGLIDRYRNFTKRLGRLIDHTVSYTNWLLQEPLRGAQLSALEKGKIVVEYDRFVYETVGGLYQVRSNALWQCLASLPFDTLTMDTLERMISEVRSAQLGACELPSNDMWEENILKLGNDEFYYVLQIMTNMATAQKRLSNRLPFVTEIAETLMKLVISFDTSEPVKVQYLLDQLRVLIDQYPTLISAGLQLIDKFQQTVVIAGGVKNVLTVFDAHNLPMRQWTPTREDLDALLSWFEGYPLLSPLQTVACHLLMSIYYGENSRGELAVPREWQLEIVRKIVVTCGRLAETTYGNKAAQNYQVFVQFEQRCKMMLLQFRVHAMDQPAADVQRTLQDPAQAIGEHFVRHTNDEPVLHQGIAAGCSVSSLAALLITTAGHWVPIICVQGMELLLVIHELADPCLAIRCLELIVPLFTSCPSALTENERFLQLLRLLIENESKVTQAEKPKLKNSVFERPSLRAMIIGQVSQYRRYGFLSPAVLVKLWSECIVRASRDIANDMAGLNLLDELAYSALKHRDAWALMRQTLAPMLKDPENPPRRARFIMDQLVRAFYPATYPMLFLNIELEHIALALLALEIEHERVEVKTGLWPELLCQLDADSSLTVQAALTKVGTALRLHYTPPPHMLVLYKAARAVANAKPTHPLYPLLCQRFFTILLARPEKDVPVYGVADRLLTVDVSLVVEVKKHLHRAEAFYAGLQRDSSKGQSGRALFARLQSTFQMFAQWLADRQLNVMSVEDLDRLPAHYCVPRLKKVFAGKQDFWLDLIDYSVQSSKESHDQGLWARAYRWPDQFPTAGALADYTEAASRTVAAGERREVALQRWLSSYEKPATVPKILFQDTKALHSAMSLPFRQRTELILGSLQKIDQHTQRLYWPTIAEFKRLKREIYEKTKILYTNEPGTAREQAKCSIMCEGAGTVHIPVQVATRNEHMVQRLEDYRRDLASTVEAAIYLPPLIMDEIVQCRMLWKYMLLETARSTEKPMTRHVVAGILQLLQTAFEMLRENSPDHLDFAVKDSFGRCLELFPELAYGEVVALLESSLRRCRKPSTTVMDLLRAKDIPIEQMKSIYELLANSTTESPAKQALFVQVFGGEVEFDMSEWLLHKNATELDVIKFLALTSIPLLAEVVDKRGGTQAAVEREKFYWIVVNHAIQLALHDFPLYFNSVLQTMLNSVSAVKSGAPPMMLVELVNALRMKVNLLPLILPMDDDELRQAHYELAVEINSRKNPFVRVTDTVIKTIASIFDLQRRENHDITDLYAHYQHRVQELTVLYGAFAHIYVLQHATQDRTPGTDAVLTVCRMFRPWLEPYQQPNAMIPIPPWNGEGAELASHMLNAFVSVLRSMLDKLRMDHAHRFLATNMVLPILLGWYNEHFNNDWMPNTVLRPLHAALLTLPWRDVLPMGYLINWLHNALKNNMPELNKFACRVFVSCPWLKEDSRWLDDGPTTRSTFLSLCVQFAHVPTVRDDEQLAQDLALVLANIALLSWGELDPADFEHVMDFYTFSAKPCTVLRSPTSPHHQLDEAVLGLLEVAGGVSSNAKNPLRVDSTDTVKRARYIRTAMRQLTGVALMPQTTSTVMHIRQQVAETMRATTAVANIKVQVAETMRTLVGVVIRPLEAVVPEDSNAHVEVQLREARALLTAMVLGIRSCKSVHQPFSNAFIEVLTSDAHASIRKPLAHGLLGVIKLFAQNTANLMALTEVTLFCCLNASANVGEGATISWAQTLELVSDSIAREWEPEVLAGDGHVLCLQLHFLAHWCDDAGDGASDGGTSVPKFNQLRQLLRHLKAVKKETDEYHIYPLWVCMVYGLLALAPTTPTASMSALVENFSEYLSLLGQQSSPRGWIAGFMHTLIAGKKIPQASQRVIALGLNYCLVNAYRTLQKAEAAKEDAGNAKAAEQSTPEEASDSGAKQPPATDPIDALRALATEPDVESLRDKIEELVESLPSQLELGATVALTKRIIGTFDSRAVRILETLHQALGWDIKA